MCKYFFNCDWLCVIIIRLAFMLLINRYLFMFKNFNCVVALFVLLAQLIILRCFAIIFACVRIIRDISA